MNSNSKALLVCDLQNGILSRLKTHNTQVYLERVASTITSARKANVRIIYVRVAFRPGHPEVTPRNPSVANVRAAGGFLEGDASTEIHAAIAPQADDIVVTKRRRSAFHGTDLDMILRCLGVETLVMAGLSTSGVVLSTVRQGLDMDYGFVVLEDLCMDPEPEIHDACVKVLGKQARIVKSTEWIAELESRE
jgi:nicotinamidase-related amidase